MQKIFFFLYLLYAVPNFRYGWYVMRKEDGHPISLWRAFFGKVPRFGAYEYDEEGCSEMNKRDYETVFKP